MDGLYPNLSDKFKTEGICPICLTEMELTSRYSCANGHMICHRCKPYYYSCPTCMSPLNVEIPPPQASSYQPPPPTHFMPHPLPQQYRPPYPSAPVEDFLGHERERAPSQNHQLKSCSYTHLGCWIKIPQHLQDLHESRCQFRPHLEEEHLPTDLNHREDDGMNECTYRVVGCKVKTSPWRISIHENYCVYKNKFQAMNDVSEYLDQVTLSSDDHFHGDPEELVECRYRRFGCMVNMPRRRKYTHEQKCNYSKYYEEGEDHETPSNVDCDPEERVTCKWSDQGCKVQPKRSRKETHEEKCNYRMEECAFKDYGCNGVFHPSRKFAHERSCEFAN